MKCAALLKVPYDRAGKWLALLIWLWAILSVKLMADGVVRVFCGNDYVILSMLNLHWGFLLGVGPLAACLDEQDFLPPLTRTMRICGKCLLCMWLGLFLTVLVAGAWLR